MTKGQVGRTRRLLITAPLLAVFVATFAWMLLGNTPTSSAASTTTITFDSLFCCPSSYTESGLTVTSHWPAFGSPGGGHLHADFNGSNGTQALSNHDGGCCTDPFVFDMGGAPFGVVSADLFAPFGGTGTNTFTASNGATFTVSTGASPTTVSFPASFQGITYFIWDVGFVDYNFMDNLVLGSADTTPPTITSVSPGTGTLWPPNHRMVPVSISITATDDTDPAPVCTVTSVSSNEPDNGLGDGDTAGDSAITGATSVDLRSERSGKGSGRVYTVGVTCTDSSGNSATSSTTVSVPHSQRK